VADLRELPLLLKYLQLTKSNTAALTAQEIADIEAAGAKGPSYLSMQILARRAVPVAALTLFGLTMHLLIGRV
jgi:hypothetical protein